MEIFEFLAHMRKEQFPIRLQHDSYNNFIQVEVDAFSERWIVSFTENGFRDFRVYKNLQDAPVIEDPTPLDSLLNRPQQSWLDAAEDLGIEFITPHVFAGLDGGVYKITGLLPQFGGMRGTLITSRKDDEEACFAASKLKGFHASGLNPTYYDKYDREVFISTLRDWSWNSDEPKPEWYVD